MFENTVFIIFVTDDDIDIHKFTNIFSEKKYDLLNSDSIVYLDAGKEYEYDSVETLVNTVDYDKSERVSRIDINNIPDGKCVIKVVRLYV